MKHRGQIAIHAAKKVDKEICLQEPFRSVLDLQRVYGKQFANRGDCGNCRFGGLPRSYREKR